MKKLGIKLKEAREKKGLKQIEAAKKLGISNGTLSGYERDYRDPDTETLKKMAELYDVSIDELLGNQVKDDLSPKEEKDIAKRMEQIRNDLMHSDGLSFSGEPMSPEAIESLMEAMEYIERQTKIINRKFTPKKYREKE
ncbi:MULTISPECIES: helix-turn-helix domain-containing protein [Bacillus]|uniref:XRE family transcriptional regulator n=1 Tax=Bacillus glycinifermentans TaxID=1664069 RepID=A0AAJ3Z1F9_9BACI|nr:MULTISPECIES: helix-turn-helix transcriptional regulator [Bacillus]KKB75320.1 immunity repressor protein [Bacillus sp. TH008]MDU0070702.1 helix-turn-helix transcriptional regulator [Bacillus sp. IG6]MED8018566.1 helix-turn-helix transcriptional regulator [Bacillus glycinifermentans]QAT67013.1 XRE family transcriptional regulator [Bacillus glycinifermentans]WKB76728.1 helix-turn-helix transcriptional regulator [Bacillus glycinifermentans]